VDTNIIAYLFVRNDEFTLVPKNCTEKTGPGWRPRCGNLTCSIC